MGESRVCSILLAIEGAILIVLANYYLNPMKFSSSCVLGTGSEKELGQGRVLDCVGCLSADNRDMVQSKLVGDIEVLIPYLFNNSRKELTEESNNHSIMSSKLLFLGQIYGQKGCLDYQCSSFLAPQDFQLTSSENARLLGEKGLQRMLDVSFTREFNSLRVLALTGRQELGYLKVVSNGIAGNFTSLMLRFRVNVVQGMDVEKEPIFLFFSLADNMFVRLLLILPVLMELQKLMNALHNRNCVLATGLLCLLGCSFLGEGFALVGSVVAVYILIGQVHGQRWAALGMCLLLNITKKGYDSNAIPIGGLCLIISGLIPVVFALWPNKDNQRFVVHIIFLMAANLIIASLFNWIFLALATPAHLLVTIICSQQSVHRTQPQRDTSHYGRLRAGDMEDEEDVLVKIDKILERH